MRLRSFLIFILLSVSLEGISQETKWDLPKSQYAKLYASWVVSDRHFDNDGNRQDNIVEYGHYSVGVYGESKWNKRLITTFNIPINSVYTELPPSIRNSSTTIFGDIDIGASYHIIKDSLFLVTGSVVLGIPTRKHEFTALKTSDNEFNQLIKIGASKIIGLGSGRGEINLYTGYNHRSLGYAEEIHFGASGSILISKNKIKLEFYLDGIEALGSDKDARFVNSTSLFSNFKEYIRLTPEFTYYFNSRWGIALSTSIHVKGRNFVADPMYSIGIIRQKIRQ